jgi:chemotaxis protein methyltransferase CheR
MLDVLAPDLDKYTFAKLRDRIAGHSGIFLDESRRPTLARVASVRMASRNLQTWSEYLALLDSPAGKEEMLALIDRVVNNETAFFRNPRHFRALAEHVLIELDRTRPRNRTLRVWSAGCSTGQEPYSIAITAAEVFGLPPRRQVEILASDISRRALDWAERARYEGRDLERVEAPYRRRYFHPDGRAHQVDQALRDLVTFHEFNLMTEPFPHPFRKVDVIFCRNVTIYFQVETSRRLMANLYSSLNEGGYLFIGFSETLWQIFDAFERVEAGGTFFYRRGAAGKPLRLEEKMPRPRSVPGGRSVERPLYLGLAPVAKAGPAPVETRPAVTIDDPETHTADSDPAREQYHRGITFLRDGAYSEALAAFQAALGEEPNLVEAHCGIAQVHANQGRYDQARQACEQALGLDDMAEEAYLLRGLILRQTGEEKQAIIDLERAAYLNPSSPTAPFHLGNAFLSVKNYDRALRAFRRTWRALAGKAEDALVDGVPVHLLREACRQHIETLSSTGRTAGEAL